MLSKAPMFEQERQRLQAEFESQGIPYVDPMAQFQKHDSNELVVSRRDFHPNGKAFSITAKLLAPEVLSLMKARE